MNQMKSCFGRTRQRRGYTNAPSPVDQLTQPMTSNGSAAKPIATALPVPIPDFERILASDARASSRPVAKQMGSHFGFERGAILLYPKRRLHARLLP
jgi:hypothetical protein